jgi:hypothetical protein
MDYLLGDSNLVTMLAGSYDSAVNVTDAQLLNEEGRVIFQQVLIQWTPLNVEGKNKHIKAQKRTVILSVGADHSSKEILRVQKTNIKKPVSKMWCDEPSETIEGLSRTNTVPTTAKQKGKAKEKSQKMIALAKCYRKEERAVSDLFLIISISTTAIMA